ncbi:MAG: permease-like cell division protein FtsX [Patescibacteria group bacterium]|nr:permease-like cell division protein FtsX [Patescibacteria group bacterium]
MFNILVKVFKWGYDLFNQERLITIINIGTVMIVSLLIWIGFLGFYFFNQLINYVEERLDFAIYFKPQVPREEILKVQKIIQNFAPGISVEFIGQETALEKFRKEAKVNPIIARALTEIQTNPLVDYLIVTANSPEIYPKIADYLDKSAYRAYIDYINYSENQRVIKRIISISNQARIFMTGFIILILVFSSLIIFNTVLSSVYSQKEMIEVLRLIGASNWFIRGPFLFYISIISLFGFIISLGIIIVVSIRTTNFWPTLIPGLSPSNFIFENFFFLNLVSFGIILIINMVATLLALEKYLKI